MSVAVPAKSLTVLALSALAAVTLTACATDTEQSASPSAQNATNPDSASEITVTTAQGEVTIPSQPERVVVIEHGILDTIDTLGAGDAVVGVPHHAIPTSLDHFATSTANTGTLFEPDYEAINAAAPDLIIVGGRSAPTLPEMQKIAPTIDLSFNWGTQGFIDSFETNTTAIGQIFGAEEQAAAAITEVTEHAQEISATAADAGAGLVIMTSAGEVSAYGPSEEGRYDFVYNLLGITPAIDQVGIDTHGDAVSFEFIADLDPDMLIVLDRDAAIGEQSEAAAAVLDNDLVNGTSAVKNEKVLYVNTENWYMSFGGITSIQGIFDEIESLVN